MVGLAETMRYRTSLAQRIRTSSGGDAACGLDEDKIGVVEGAVNG